ncbi:hypothetical protein FE257_006502 [Aspergillus nanangensis]|uniref:WD repeat protein n=1 Tax=Aspergillus nanangensis TaxID=2582783 RepID=A0AAD4GY77_ASPNN|nr:hypothetical protein FE257_006502 [Aspergillus nanangensis]
MPVQSHSSDASLSHPPHAAVDPDHRDLSAPDPGPCNIPLNPSQSSPSSPSEVLNSREGMPERDPPPPVSPPDWTGGVALDDVFNAADSDFVTLPTSPSQDVTNGDANIWTVTEVLHSTFAPGEPPHNGDMPGPRPAPTSPPNELYLSDSEMTDALSDLGGVPLGPFGGGQMGMGSLVHHIMDNAATRYHISTISEDSEDDDEAGLIMDYETPMDDNRSTPLSPQDEDDLDDTHKFYSDDSVPEDYTTYPLNDEEGESLSEIDFDDFYREHGPVYDAQFTEIAPTSDHDDHNYFSEIEDPTIVDAVDPHFPASVIHGTTHERNLNIDQFISQWLQSLTRATPCGLPPIIRSSSGCSMASIHGWTPPAKIARPGNYPREFYDIQQIPWETLGVRRSEARELRDLWYTSYHNLEYSNQRSGTKLPQEEFYFREKSMYTKCKATIEHFQLRNLMSVAAYNTVHFAHESKLYSWVPGYDDLSCLIDLSKPSPETGFQGPVKISTMKSAHDVAIVGGFAGEYAVHAVGPEGNGVEGFVTKDFNGITNHVDIVPSRTGRSPLGIFASNDRHLRVLDCETNTFIADHELSRAINCTSTSADGRLRVVIGDSPDAWVVEAESGRPVHPLRGHRDFGFACAWSPDMRHIATSNQDKTVIIWDARTWRILETIESDVAGYRSLRFSPVGGGPRTLLLCEPADRIAIVNAQTYQTRQVHEFFGEIGGADYAADGSNIWVANTDEHFGGFMEYERRQWGQRYGQREWPNEWVREAELDEDERCMLSEKERQQRFWWNLSDEEHEALLGIF